MRFLVFCSFFLIASVSQALTGNYRLKYLHSELKTLNFEEKTKNQTSSEFDYSAIESLPALDVLYLLHKPGPTATLTGAGIEKPRECGNNTEKLPTQKLRCEPYSIEPFKDEKTGCEGTTLYGELILFSIVDNVRYSKNQLVMLNKEKKSQCFEYLESLPIHQALEQNEISLSEENLPDVIVLTHLYQAISVSDSSVEVLKGVYTGTYHPRYTGESRAKTWQELSDGTQERKVEGTEFNAALAPLHIRDLPEVLLFHDAEKNTLKLAGAGSEKIRKCQLNKSKSSGEITFFECPVFKAKEEELGTGCTIEHQILNEIKLEKNQYPRLNRIEKRKLVESEDSHCDAYKAKIAEELKDKRAELFFQSLLEQGGITSVENLGNVFVLEHVFELKVPSTDY